MSSVVPFLYFPSFFYDLTETANNKKAAEAALRHLMSLYNF